VQWSTKKLINLLVIDTYPYTFFTSLDNVTAYVDTPFGKIGRHHVYAVGITPPKQFNANQYISFGYGLQPINNARLLIGG
jgi:hypothetical protein